MTAADTSSDPTAETLAWLAAEPADDLVADLAALRQRLRLLSTSPGAPAHLDRCVSALDARALDVSERFKPRLLTASLPLPREVRGIAADVIATLSDLAGIYQWLVAGMRDSGVQRLHGRALGHAARGLRLLGEVFLLSAMAGTAPPPGSWRRVHGLTQAGEAFASAADPDAPTATAGAVRRAHPDAGVEFRRLVALSVVQPETFTAREAAWIFEYLEERAALAVVSARPASGGCAFWIDGRHDEPPVASVRRRAPASEGLLFLSTIELSRRAAEQEEWLEERICQAEVLGLGRDRALLDPAASRLPVGLTPMEVLSVLRRLRDRWTEPQTRALPREEERYSVQVCAGLLTIWALHRFGPDHANVAEWTVFNESPGGFAITCLSAAAGTLSAGAVLALRRTEAEPWSICVVRWLRGAESGRVEVGLQSLSRSCTPVSIGFRGSEERAVRPALLLPSAPARSSRAILAPAGTYSSRRFVLLHEGERLYVTQGRVLSLELQTAAVEVFQYEADPYPV